MPSIIKIRNSKNSWGTTPFAIRSWARRNDKGTRALEPTLNGLPSYYLTARWLRSLANKITLTSYIKRDRKVIRTQFLRSELRFKQDSQVFVLPFLLKRTAVRPTARPLAQKRILFSCLRTYFIFHFILS